MINQDIIYEYWRRKPLGEKLIASSYVSDLDLLFLIPNNVKKRHGIPLTRTAKRGRKKREYCKNRRTRIYSFSLFEILEETIDKTLRQQWTTNKFFGQFVDIKNLEIGDKDFYMPPRFDASVLDIKPIFKINQY